MKKSNFGCFVHISCLVLALIVAEGSARECGDPECKTPVARGYATLGYTGGGGNKVNLKSGEKLEILGTNVGKNRDFLVRKEDGKEGLANNQFVKETSVLIKVKNRISVPEDGDEKIVPSKTNQPNVIDGTTLSSPELVTDKVEEGIPLSVEEKTPDLGTATEKINSQEQKSLPSEASVASSVEATDSHLNATKEDESEPDEEDEDDDETVDDEDDERTVEDEEDENDNENESIRADKVDIKSPDILNGSSEEAIEQKSNTSNIGNEDTVQNTKSEEFANKVVPEIESESKNNAESILKSELVDEFIPEQGEGTTSSTSTPGEAIHTTSEELPKTTELVTEIPLVSEPDLPIPESVETTTPSLPVEVPQSIDQFKEHLNDSAQDTEILEEVIQSDQTIVDTRKEIPVTEQPEFDEPVVVESVNLSHDVIKEAPKTDSALPQPPHGILRGGLGNLLSHSHHHHHHGHGHGHGHHHGHHIHKQHHHHHPDENSQEQIKHEHQMPFLGHLEQGSAEDLERREPIDVHSADPEEDRLPKQTDDSTEDGFCDQQSCPQPNPSQSSPQQQRANGFHHPMVSNPPDSVPMSFEQHEQHELPSEQKAAEAFSTDNDHVEEDVDYAKLLVLELFKLSDLILLLGITSFTLIVFSLGHYLINKNRKEKPLIYKLNMVERDLMASHKENAMLKSDLVETRHKLTSIENNSFGSNDMVIALRQEIEGAEQAKLELQEQITSLEKELENAAEAGLELNKMVAELLNQSGSDSIALSVDELQKQLNEQQQTILSMNTTLADKSRENSELQITLANQSAKFSQDIEELQQTLNDLKLEKNNLEIELNNYKSGQSSQLEVMRKETSAEISKLNKEVKLFQSRWEDSKKALGTAEAKVEALEECIKEIKRGNSNGTVDGLIDSAELKAQVVVLNKEKSSLQDRLQGEIVARQLLDDHVKIINEEISALKKEYSQAEKDKLEAETRLEVLSSYFKDKETQLQKELSIKEAMWMQQQGETTSTVERIRLMQDEIQQLKSQNDKLRAEIEAQATAHKAQYTALETRSHDAWLAARQAERRLEEARNESSALRRKLTVLGDVSATNTTTDGLIPNAVPPTDLNLSAPSPIRVESPNAPMMGLPPPPFIPPPFGPPFMPPFMPPPAPGEMRPAPLGRLMSPPPNRYSPNIMDSRDRYSPDRGRYSPDSRYDYSVMSNYDTETDFSPPPSPPPHSRRSNYDRERDPRSDRDRDHDMRDRERDLRERDGRTSGSGGGPDRTGGTGGGYPKAFSPPGMRTTSPPIQDPRNKKYQATAPAKGGFSSGSQDSIATRKSGKQYKNNKVSS